MRITLRRSGGLAGIRAAVSLDTSKLSAAKGAELRRLIEAADFFKLPATLHSDRAQPDRFQYELSVEDGGRSHTVTMSEEALPPALKGLIGWLQKNPKP